MRQKQTGAMTNAERLSSSIKDCVFMVLDKPHKPPVIVCDQKDYEEKVNEGFITLALYKNGVRV